MSVWIAKAELIDAMTKAADIRKTVAEAARHGFTGSVQVALQKGDPITLTRFGTIPSV